VHSANAAGRTAALDVNLDFAIKIISQLKDERTWSSEDTGALVSKSFLGAWLAPPFDLRGYVAH
jgi:hypothetical protein